MRLSFLKTIVGRAMIRTKTVVNSKSESSASIVEKVLCCVAQVRDLDF
jgi:hypothetical protein